MNGKTGIRGSFRKKARKKRAAEWVEALFYPLPSRSAGVPLSVLALAFTLLGNPSRAQGDPIAERPAWNDPGNPLPVADLENATFSPGSQTAENSGLPAAADLPPADDGTTLDASPSADDPAGAAPLIADDSGSETAGGPSGKNFFLPSFQAYGRPWFEQEGLKFRFGPGRLRMTLATSIQYNDNIFGSHVNPTADLIFSATPGFLLDVGAGKNALHFIYTPSFNAYQKTKGQDNVGQNLSVKGGWIAGRYSTDLLLTFTTSNLPNATQTGGSPYSNLGFNWNNQYYLTGKIFVAAGVAGSSQVSGGPGNYQTLSLTPQLGYKYSPKLTLSVGPTLGVSYVPEGTQTFESLGVAATYSTLRKLSFTGSVGVQATQFGGSGSSSNLATPIFGLNATYAATARSSFRLGLVRSVQPSGVEDEATSTTSGVELGLSQEVFGKITLTLSLGYQLLEYQGGSSLGRTDNYFFGSIALNYRFWQDAFTLSASYQRQHRTSNIEANNYDVDIYALSLGYDF